MSTRHTAVILLIAALANGCAHRALTFRPSLTNITTNPPPVPKAVTEPSPVSKPLRLKLTLSDGSQIIGVPSVNVLVVKTSFANMQVPLERIRNATFSKDHTEIVLLLTNGDRMTAAMGVAEFQLSTIFGKAEIDPHHVVAFAVLPGGATEQWPCDGLWGYWPLDGDVKDASGNGHDGIIKGAKPTDGVRGQAYSFDGKSTIEVGTPDFPNEEYSIAGWIRTDRPARTEDWRTWIDKFNNVGGPVAIGIGDGRVDGGENGPQYMVWNGGETSVNMYPGKVNLRDGQWHHCAATYKREAQKLFVDGTLIAKSSYSGPLPANSTPVTIGGHHFGSMHHPWIGDVDEVFIYQRALTDDELQSLYRHGRPAK